MGGSEEFDASKIETRLFINGEFRKASDKGTFTLVSPFTRKSVCEVSEATEQDTDDAVAAAKAAQPAWAALSPGDRGVFLKRWATLIKEHTEELAKLEAISMGKPVGQYIDAALGVSRLESVAEMGWTVHGKTSLNQPGQLNLTLRQPFGVVAGIIPWNGPVLFFLWKAGAALATGNTVVIKSSEKAPLTSSVVAKLAKEAGFPAGVLNHLSGHGNPSGACLANHMDVRAISFTGSARTGRLIQQASAKSNLKQVVLELGGKSPAVVCDDADLDQAVPELAMSILMGSGQVCVASSRVYVQETIRDRFIEKYKQILENVKLGGDPSDKGTQFGPQADQIQYDNVRRYLASGKESGAKLAFGGAEYAEDGGLFVQPTIFTDSPEDSKIMKEEIFGSIISINSFKLDEEALRKANDTEYGLYASVYTKSLDRALAFAKGLEAGNVGVNCTSPNIAMDLAFGGWKGSGQGREGIVDSLEHYLEHKTVIIKTGEMKGLM